MTELLAAQIHEIDAGKLTNISFANNIWSFEFDGDFYLEAYAGWRLLLHNYGAKLVLGSRDLEEASDKYEQIIAYLGDSPCSILTINNLSNVHQLQFIDSEDNQISLDLLSNSYRKPNFKAVVDGKAHYDIEPK